MPDISPEIDAKIAVLEVEVEHLKNNAAAHVKWLGSIDGKVDDIKSRLDKQNGTLPHLAEDVKALSESIKGMHESLTMVQSTAQESKIKMAAIWGGTGTILAVLLGVVLKFLLHI